MGNQKKFLTYKEQIEHLKNDRNLIISDDKKLFTYLKNYNYEAIINAMVSNELVQSKDKYCFINGLTSCGLIAMYDFDNNIKAYFLKKILRIESQISTAIVHIIPKYFTDREAKHGWYIDELVSGCILHIPETSKWWRVIFPDNPDDSRKSVTHELLKKNNVYLCKNRKEHPVNPNYSKIEDVPIWSLSINWTFGTIINIYRAVNEEVKQLIIESIRPKKSIDTNTFIAVLRALNVLRNRICHNNTIYNAVFADDMDLLKNLIYKITGEKTSTIFLKHITTIINLFDVEGQDIDEAIIAEYKKTMKIIKNNSNNYWNNNCLNYSEEDLKRYAIKDRQKFKNIAKRCINQKDDTRQS